MFATGPPRILLSVEIVALILLCVNSTAIGSREGPGDPFDSEDRSHCYPLQVTLFRNQIRLAAGSSLC